MKHKVRYRVIESYRTCATTVNAVATAPVMVALFGLDGFRVLAAADAGW